MSKTNVSATSLVKTSGCAAKLGPGVLDSVLSTLPKFHDERLLVGFDTCDDACVYQINDSTVAIQTVDFFPPMVDDPYSFGQIAAANALSDVYAMGGTPATAMNLVCFPSCMDLEILKEILEGGYSKVAEAGAVIAGGHTIADPTPKYGLCVTGFAHPKEILTNANAKTGDVLVLTKPLGMGIMNTAAKAGLLKDGQIDKIVSIMSTTNKYARDAFQGLTVHSCTDITGFSTTGHSYEMASGSKKSIELFTGQIPVLTEALEFASMGIIPEGMYNNQDYLSDKFVCKSDIPQNLEDVLLDPQTSGGLLVSMPEKEAKEFLKRMECYTPYASVVGQVLDVQEKPVILSK